MQLLAFHLLKRFDVVMLPSKQGNGVGVTGGVQDTRLHVKVVSGEKLIVDSRSLLAEKRLTV